MRDVPLQMSVIESTCPKTASQKRKGDWVKLREDRSTGDPFVFVFTDGSSLGSFAAVVVTRLETGTETVAKFAGYEKPTSTRNVGAELNGALLGLSNAPAGATVILVFDYLGIGAWLTGWWQIKDMEVAAKIAKIKGVIRDRQLYVKYVHHRGHQRDSSDFTRFNTAADELATAKAEEVARGG